MQAHQPSNTESGDCNAQSETCWQSDPSRGSTELPVHTATPTDANTAAPIVSSDKQVVLLLVGLIGSGKSTFAQALEQHFPQFQRCSQDDLGDRRSVEALAKRSLRDGLSVIIDRTNFDESQRTTWINIAHEFPNTLVWVLVFETPYEVCAARVTERTGHPTITSPELGLQVLQRFRSQYRPPSPHEGYTRILYLKPSDLPNPECSEEVVRDVMRRLQDTPEVVAIPPSQHGHRNHRGGYRGFGSPRRGFDSRGVRPYRGGWSPRGGHGDAGIYQSNLQHGRAPVRIGQGSQSSSSGFGLQSDPRNSHQQRRGPRYDPTQDNWRRS